MGIIMFRKMLDKPIAVAAEGGDPLGVLREPHQVINFKVQREDRHTGKIIPWQGQVGRTFTKSVGIPVS